MTGELTPASTRRLLVLAGLAAVVGGLAGGAAYLLVRTTSLITHVALLGDWGWGEIPSLSHLERSPRLPIAAAIGALVVAVIARSAPIIRGHRIPEAMDAKGSSQCRAACQPARWRPTRGTRSKPSGTQACMASRIVPMLDVTASISISGIRSAKPAVTSQSPR